LQLLHGAAQGLKYIHSAHLVHGDIKGAPSRLPRGLWFHDHGPGP